MWVGRWLDCDILDISLSPFFFSFFPLLSSCLQLFLLLSLFERYSVSTMLVKTWDHALSYGSSIIVAMLAGGADSRIVLSPRVKTISDNNCLDIDNSDPLPLRYGYPSWKTSDNPNCQSVNKVDSEGHCFHALNPGNDCSAFCQISSGWFYGEPIDAMDGKWCEVGQPCAKTITISKTSGDAVSINSGDNVVDQTVRSNSSTEVDSRAISISVKSDTTVSAGFAVPSIIEVKASLSLSSSYSDSFTKTRTQSWSRTITETKTFGVTNTTTFAVNIQEADSLTKPTYATNYCGSWFAVPIVGISCGRGAAGKLIQSNKTEEAYCALYRQEEASFSHCFSYTFKDQKEQDMTKYRWAFVLRDCRFGQILPGEWQPLAFQHSFAPQIYTAQHIERYGYSNLPRNSPNKPEDDNWNHNGIPSNAFTKDLGPIEHTIKVCSPEGYCVRHKLTDGNCHNLPRGRTGVQAVQIESASTTPGNCCTLFSRHECHGQAQNVVGNITSFHEVGFHRQAHSIICNVKEYCDLDLIDTIRGAVSRR